MGLESMRETGGADKEQVSLRRPPFPFIED